MKKFISMIIAATMLLSLCVVSVNAEAAATLPTINVYVEKYDGTNPPSNYKPQTYDVYKVSYTTSGIDGNVDKLTGMAIKFTISDSTKIASKTWQLPKTSGSAAQKDANGVKAYLLDGEGAPVKPFNLQQGLIVWKDNAAGIDAFDWDTYPDGGTQESKPYIETLIYVNKDETVTFTYQTALNNGVDPQSEIELIDWEHEEDPTAYRYYNDEITYTVNGKVGNVATLGEPVPDPIIKPDDDKVVVETIGTTGLTDLGGDTVGALGKNYGIARFTQDLDTATNDYYVYAKDTNGNTNITVTGGTIAAADREAAEPFKVVFADLIETIEANVTFYTVIRSTTRVIDEIGLVKVAK